jgi:hypothetical protein
MTMGISYRETSGGDLVFIADNEARSELAYAYREGGYPRAERDILEAVCGGDICRVYPEDIGALTDSPLFEGGPPKNPSFWWFPNYQITDPWSELKNKGRVVFSKV